MGQLTYRVTLSLSLPNPAPALVLFLGASQNQAQNNRDLNLEIGSKGELIARSKLSWETQPFNLHSQYYMVFGRSFIIKILFSPPLPASLHIYFFSSSSIRRSFLYPCRMAVECSSSRVEGTLLPGVSRGNR
jgi:hypothetical protein